MKDLFLHYEIQETWIHVVKNQMLGLVLKASTLYVPITMTAEETISLGSKGSPWTVDNSHAGTLILDNGSFSFSSSNPEQTKSCICFRKLLFPERERDEFFFRKWGEEMKKLLDKSLKTRENEKGTITTISQMTPSPPEGILKNIDDEANIDLQNPLDIQLEELRKDQQSFIEAFTRIEDPLDINLLSLKLEVFLKKAENTAK